MKHLNSIFRSGIIVVALMLLSEKSYTQDSCDAEMQTSVDKFTGEKTIYTSLGDPIYMTKVIAGKRADYYLSLKSYGETVSVHKKGVYVLFSDNTKFIKLNESIDCKVNEDGDTKYVYTAFVSLTPAEVIPFTKKTITDIKLYIYENEIGERNARELKCGTKELLKIK